MELKEYVWVKDGKPVEIVGTCGGTEISDHNRCHSCLGEERSSECCIDTLIAREEIKEVNTNMNLIEALQKYKKVTNDGGKTVYSLNKNNTIIMHTNGAGGGFNPTIDLFTSTGWEEYKEPLVLPKRCMGDTYYFTDSTVDVDVYYDDNSYTDTANFNTYNYFTDKMFAQYVADKQFIQRTNLVLGHLNKDNPDKEVLISKYIRDNHKEIIDRIKEYEDNNL